MTTHLDVSIPEQMELDILPHYAAVVVKLNNIDISNIEIAVETLMTLKSYFEDNGGVIHFASAGIHLKGKKKIPHVHWHLIMETDIKPKQNCSEHRKRWLVKNHYDRTDFDEISVKYHAKLMPDTPRYSTLSYPLKEGLTVAPFARMYLYLGQPMDKQVIKFLRGVGKEINDVEAGINLRREKCEERKKNAYHATLEYAIEHKSKFSSYAGLKSFMNPYFRELLAADSNPTLKNYSEHLKLISISLGIAEASDFFD